MMRPDYSCGRRRVASALVVVGALLGVLTASRPAHAQTPTERDDVHLRNDCRLAAKTLETGHPAPHSKWALEVISRCDETAGPALRSLWTVPPLDSAALELLYRASGQVRDRRIYDVVTSIARDASRPVLLRFTALRVLAEYVDPTVVVDLDLLRPPQDSGSVVEVVQDHAWQITGAQPLAADVRSVIMALFGELAQSDPDPSVRYAAGYLVRRFRW